jgi:hypothetical protein
MLAAGGLLVLIAVVFAPLRHAGFVSLDDPQYVTNNLRVTSGLTWDGVKWALTATYAANWHPLTWMSHMLDVELFGVNAGPHHLVNILLHGMSTLVLFAFLRRTTGTLGRSVFVAALFAVHPLHIESVAWVAERKDVLSTFFWMLTLYSYSSYVRDPRLAKKLIVFLFFGLGLMSKPMLVTLPFVLLLLDYWPLRRIAPEAVTRLSAWAPLVLEKLPMFLLVIVSAIMTIVAQRGGGAVIAVKSLPLPTRVGAALVSYVEYIGNMLWPTGLAVFYPFVEPSIWWTIAAAAVMVAATLCAIRYGRRFPYLPVGWAWYVGTLVPVVGLIQVGAQGRADRYTYVPLIGLFFILAWGAADIARRWQGSTIPLRLSAGALIVACVFVSMRQVTYWQDSLSLWSRAVAVTKGNYRAEDQLGVALSDRGMLKDAIDHYTASLAIWPEYPEAHNNLGAARMDQGRYEDAVREFSAAAQRKPWDANFRYNLAVALDAAGRRAEAIKEVETGLKTNPDNASLLRAAEVFGIPKR